LDQLLFDITLDLDLARALRLRPGIQGRREACGDQTPADTADSADADAEGRDNLIVGACSRGSIRQQEDASVGEFAGRALSDGNQVFQVVSFLRSQHDSILVHRRLRNLGKRAAYSSSYGSRFTYQSKIDGILGRF
jgi:hypothetical protein